MYACRRGLLCTRSPASELSSAQVSAVIQPCRILAVVREPASARFTDGAIRNLRQRRVSRMVALHVRIVRARVITADHGPTWITRPVVSRAVEQVGMEEQYIARLHFDIHERVTLQNLLDASRIGASLVARELMLDSSELDRKS